MAERDGIRVRKTIEETDGETAVMRYSVASERDDEVGVRVSDRLPPGVRCRSAGAGTRADGGDAGGPRFVYSCRIDGGETVTAGLNLGAPGDLQPAETTDLRIESIRPTTRDWTVEPAGTGRPGREGDPRPELDRWRNGDEPVDDRTVRSTLAAGDFHDGGSGSPNLEPGGNGTASRNGQIGSPPSTRSAGVRLERRSVGEPSDTLDGEERAGTVLVGIPAYDEAETIAEVVDRSLEHADEVLVVDDGSEDRTASTAAEAGATVLEHNRNRGYGAALKTLFLEASRRDADSLVVLDGDGQHDPSEVPKLVEAHRETGAEVVIGSRFVDGSSTTLPRYRRWGIVLINLLSNLSMGVVRPRSYVTDTQSGFRLYDRRAIGELARANRIGDRMDASTDILFFAHQRNYAIEEVGATVDYDVEDPSSHNPLFHGYQLVRNILKTVERERPLLSLGVPGLVVASVGFGLVMLSTSTYLRTGTIPFEVAVLSIIGIICGLFACFTSIVLHALNTYFGS